MIKILITIGFLLTTMTSFSQKKVDLKFNIGPELYTPVGNLRETRFTGIGGMFEMEVLPVKNIE